jgi:conjugal transfer ATP-binding protein TraC
MSDFFDSLMGMLNKGGETDGAATATTNLQQTWDYPSVRAVMPWRYYDETTDLFVNAGTAGFILEAAPLPGANEQVVAALDDMLRKKLPRKTPVTVIMVASKCVGESMAGGSALICGKVRRRYISMVSPGLLGKVRH